MELCADVQVINTVVKHTYTVDILCIDEIHRTGADVLSKVFTSVHYKYIIGLTATFDRLDGKHELIAKYCPVIDTITQLEALSNGWVSEYKEYQVLIDVDDIEEYKNYNKEFIRYFEFFNFDFSVAMACLGKEGWKFKNELANRLKPNATREEKSELLKIITINSMGFMRALQSRKKFINNHPKKVQVAQKIIAAREGKKIITFSNNIKMAESIGVGKVYSGKDTKKKGRITMEEFNRGDFLVCNSVAKLIEGADIPGLSVAIILGLDSSETKAIQKKGRVIRKEANKVAEIFNIVIADSVETKWFTNSHKTSQYITIDEEGLNDVLLGKEPKPYVKKIKDFTLRY